MSQLELFDLDEHLGLVEKQQSKKLSVSQRDDLLMALRREPWLTVQSEILKNINGRLFKLSTLDLTKEQALIAASKEQGVVMGLRMFFDIVQDLLANAENEEGKDAD